MTGEDIANIREKLGLSQSDLARVLNTTRQNVWSWEHEEHMPSRITEAFIKHLEECPCFSLEHQA